MTLQRALGLALTAVSSCAVATMSGSWSLPLLVCLACALSFVVPFSLEISTRKRVIASLLLGLLFTVKLRLATGVVRDSVILNGGLGFTFAQYVLVLQAGLFFVSKSASEAVRVVRASAREPLSPVLAAFALVATGFAGDVYIRGEEVRLYEALAVVVVFLVAAFLGASMKRSGVSSRRWRRLVLTFMVLLAALGLSKGVSEALLRYRYELDQVVMSPFAGLFTKSGIGFSGTGQLGSVAAQKSTDSEDVALRILAESEPGYLRGKAFSEYVGSRWDTAEGSRHLPRTEPPAGLPAVRKKDRVFRLRNGAEGPWHAFEVWPAKALPACFTRLDSQFFSGNADRLQVDLEDIPRIDGVPRYTVYGGGRISPEPLSDSQRYLAVPAGLDERVIELAQGLFEECRDPGDKMRAVTDYFQRNYRYSLGISIPTGQDPLTWFLLERPAAHCEFFASGAALLLRLGGVPCRYVTGFVASEWNGAGGYWVARNRDAHAWVEAHDGAHWVIVEPTPADGVPSRVSMVGTAQWWDFLKFRFRELYTAVVDDGVKGLAGWMTDRVADLFRGWEGSMASLALIMLLAVVIWVKVRRIVLRKGRGSNRELRRWHKVLGKADREAARLGHVRAPGETLHAFARRISQGRGVTAREHCLADWYVEYARVRYDGNGQLAELASLREKLTQRHSS